MVMIFSIFQYLRYEKIKKHVSFYIYLIAVCRYKVVEELRWENADSFQITLITYFFL